MRKFLSEAGFYLETGPLWTSVGEEREILAVLLIPFFPSPSFKTGRDYHDAPL